MLIDVITVAFIIIFCIVGMRRGFLNGLLSFVTIFTSIIISIFLARPVALLLDNWFDLGGVLGGWFTGEGTLDTMARNNGVLVLTIATAIVLFILIRLILWMLRRHIRRLKDYSYNFNRIDQFFGIFLGAFRFAIYAFTVSTFLMVASSISFLDWLQEFLFEDSTVAYWIYSVSINIVDPLVQAILG